MGIGFSIAPPEVTSSPQRSHPKQASETQISVISETTVRNFFRSPKSAPKVMVRKWCTRSLGRLKLLDFLLRHNALAGIAR